MAFSPPGPPPPPLPAACADCVNTMQLAQPGAAPQNSPYKLARASDGKMRIDCGMTSVITDPKTQQITLLDHAAKEVRTIPMAKAGPPNLPGMPLPGAPGMPAVSPPAPPAANVKDLGKRIVDGMEVHGQQFTVAAPPAGMPNVPAGMPNTPPGMPKAPPVPTVTEVWTSTALKIPVVTRTVGPFGKQTCICKNATGSEPHPSLFQIPPGYKVLPPKPPA